jgi:hypothetical protein
LLQIIDFWVRAVTGGCNYQGAAHIIDRDFILASAQLAYIAASKNARAVIGLPPPGSTPYIVTCLNLLLTFTCVRACLLPFAYCGETTFSAAGTIFIAVY